MIKISNLTMSVTGTEEQLKRKSAALLGLTAEELTGFSILRQSIDARKKQDIRYVYTVALSCQNEEVQVAKCPGATLFTPQPYAFPQATRKSKLPVVIVGMGPAGLFAALNLARAGVRCIVLERGRAVEDRSRDVSKFWESGQLLPDSNVQFGEGGAGTFSDGKLSTGINDPRISAVLDTFIKFGAPRDIAYSHKPHIGTDVLKNVVKSIRRELLALGCEIRFEHRLDGLKTKKGHVSRVAVSSPTGPYDLECDTVILAPGHSARDTFRMLVEAGVPMEAKAFAIGLRIEHLQRAISKGQYGPNWESLPPSDYKLACHLPNGRSAFSFCVCPGGQVVAAASEAGCVVTNGMSNRARDGANCNGGFLVGVGPEDFGGKGPLDGMAFQAQWEAAAARLGGGRFYAPVQTVAAFQAGIVTKRFGLVEPSYRPGVTSADLSKCLPGFVTETLKGALPLFENKLRGFANEDALLTGVETRSSSPVRILRGEDFQSSIAGLYPCGEGAGYAGGITSSAVDGIKVAEAVATAN